MPLRPHCEDAPAAAAADVDERLDCGQKYDDDDVTTADDDDITDDIG